jgi:hypothetical protein
MFPLSKSHFKSILCLLVLACLIVPVSAWSDTLNNQDRTYYVYGSSFSYEARSSYLDTVLIKSAEHGGYTWNSLIIANSSTSSNYFAIDFSNIQTSGNGAIALLDANRNAFYGYPWFSNGLLGSFSTFSRWEFFRAGTTLYAYKDGVLMNTFEDVPGDLSYSYAIGSHSYFTDVWYADDISFGNSFSDTGLISVMPNSWHIKKDMINPSNFAMIDSNGNQVYNDHFNVQWSLGAYADGWQATQNPPDTRYKITIAAPSGMKVYDNYIKISDYGTAAGIVSVPMNNTYIGNQPLEYGIYWVTLYDGTAVKSTDYFYVLGTGATVTWGSATYPTGSTATVSYSISPSYYDTATYNYEIKVIDAYGTVKKTQTVSGSTGSISFTMDSSTYADGVYYAELVAVTKSDASEIVMNYGLTEVNSYIPITGYVVDQDNVALQGASVNVTQGTSTLVSVSNTSGYFSSSNNWLAGSEVNVTTTLSGHTPDYNLFTPLAADAISLNITLVNSTPIYSGVAIGGVIKDTQYHSTIPSANVYERINGTSATPSSTTANGAGYYIFNDLVNGTTCDIWSQKIGFANSTVEQKLAVGT